MLCDADLADQRDGSLRAIAGAGRRQRRSGGRLRDRERRHTSGLTRTTVIRLALSPCGGSTQLQREAREPRRGRRSRATVHTARERWNECGKNVKPPPHAARRCRRHVGHVVVSTVDSSLIHAGLQAAAPPSSGHAGLLLASARRGSRAMPSRGAMPCLRKSSRSFCSSSGGTVAWPTPPGLACVPGAPSEGGGGGGIGGGSGSGSGGGGGAAGTHVGTPADPGRACRLHAAEPGLGCRARPADCGLPPGSAAGA